jgi:hypothetical protein
MNKKNFTVIISSQGEILIHKTFKTTNAVTALQGAMKEIELSNKDSVKIDVRES